MSKFIPEVDRVDLRPQYFMVRMDPALSARLEAAYDRTYPGNKAKRKGKSEFVRQMIDHCLKDMGV